VKNPPRKYDEDFKRSIVHLRESGRTLKQLEQEFGVSDSAVISWCKKYATIQVDDDGAVMTMKQIQDLQRRNAQLEEENQILKKAIAIFTPRSGRE